MARVHLIAALVAGTGLAVVQGRLPPDLHVIAFGGLSTIPLRVAEAQALFAKRGLTVRIEITPNSTVLRDGLAAGRYDIAHAAVDNAVAMVETARADVVIVMGGDDSMNELVVQPGIDSVEALRGTTVIVDAPNTAYALQLKKVLRTHGLEAGRDYTLTPVGGTPQRFKAMVEGPTYAASMLNPPYSLLAAGAGLRSLGSARDLLGAYQGSGVFVRRSWASANRGRLVGYLAAYVEALRWFRAPAHERDAIALLEQALDLPGDVASAAYRRAMAVPGGLAPDARLDVQGLRRVLELRAELEGAWSGRAPAPERYFDTQYYDDALAGLPGAR